MLRTAYKIIACLIIALGSAHLIFTGFNFSEFTLEAMWFAGSGLAIIFAGFLNLVLCRGVGRDPLVRVLCVATDLILTLLFVAALRVLREPQVYLGILLFALATASALMLRDTASANKQSHS
jgi:hypothetical protein